MQNYSKLKSILITLTTITASAGFKSEHNIKTQQSKYLGDLVKYLEFDFLNIAKEIINDIFKKAEELELEVNDFLAVEKYNDIFVMVWYSNKHHFVHVIEKGSSMKGTNLFTVCEDVVKINGADYPTDNRSSEPDATFLVSHPDLSKMLDFEYSMDQPDIALMSMLLGGNPLLANEFVNRGWPKYGNTFEECEPEYFENNPELKKYSSPVKAEWDANHFVKMNIENN